MVFAKHLAEPVYYDKGELEAIDKHIETYFGKVKNVFHEFVSEGILVVHMERKSTKFDK